MYSVFSDFFFFYSALVYLDVTVAKPFIFFIGNFSHPDLCDWKMKESGATPSKTSTYTAGLCKN